MHVLRSIYKITRMKNVNLQEYLIRQGRNERVL